MDPKDEKRLDELLNEVNKIFSPDSNPREYAIVIKDINRELREILERNKTVT